MTTKAKKFRIRRNPPTSGEARSPRAQTQDNDSLFAGPEDGLGDAPFPTAGVPAPREDEIDAIRREGLTGRQLRMARRVAQKHGLAPTSDFDAVRLLREQGIDPFERSNMLSVVTGSAQREAPMPDRLPQTVKPVQLPSTEVMAEDNRAKEIMRMQRDIVRRRRRRAAQLIARLAFFVFLPTIITGYYFFKIATPMFESHAEFVIQQANPAGASSSLGGLFSGTGLATAQDSITVQGYLQSRDAMLRLNDDLGFIKHFQQPQIDPLQRLEIGTSLEDAFKVFRRHVKISYDPTEGIIKMDVIAADPNVAVAFSERLIAYAEEQVDNLTQRLREDQMRGARESFEEAEAKLIAAQETVANLQERLGVLDPLAESSALMGQITTFETQLQEKRLQLQQLLDNASPNQARVDGTEGDIRRLEALIAELRAQMTEDVAGRDSMARITGQLRLAETDLETRRLMMTQALQQMETARTEANRQTRYLSLGVSPIAPDEAAYPRALENTALALLIFGGIYLMVSITASILREQVAG